MRTITHLILSCILAFCTGIFTAPDSRAENMINAAKHHHISIEEALLRIAKARKQIAADRNLLNKSKSKMEPARYQVLARRLEKREALAKDTEEKIRSLEKSAAREREIREHTGEDFYEQQARFYKNLNNDDIDLYLESH